MIQAAVPPLYSILNGAELPEARKNPNSITPPVIIATGTPLYLAFSESLWSRQLHYLHTWSPLGQRCQRLEKYPKGTIIPAALATGSPKYLEVPGPCNPSSCATFTPGPHGGRPKSPRAASGAKPLWTTHIQRWRYNHNWNSGAVWLKKRTPNLPTTSTSCRLSPHDQLSRLCLWNI